MLEREYLRDQRNKESDRGKFQLGNIDKKEARRQKKCDKFNQDRLIKENRGPSRIRRGN